MIFRYIFTLDNGEKLDFTIDANRGLPDERELHADWTLLSYQQCPNCPLKPSEHRHCPVAIDIESIAGIFGSIKSFDRVNVRVISPNREYSKETDAQTGLNAMLGLVMSTSRCPILSELRPMALNHLPFSTLEETLVRTAGMYLLREYLRAKKGEEPDYELKNLEALYKQLGMVNRALKWRVDGSGGKDANINAINAFFSLSALVEMSIQDKVIELEVFFNS